MDVRVGLWRKLSAEELILLNCSVGEDSLFFFPFISWRLITLQYCSCFCPTLTWISHGFTCVESPLDCREIQPVHPKGNQSWIFLGRTDAQAEALIIWPPDGKKWLTGKDPDAGKDWRPEEKGTTENEMDGWNHYLHGHELEQAPWVSGGQRSLGCCSPWGHKQLDTMSEWSDDI